MLDPGLEHLHRHGRAWRWTTERRPVIRQLQFDLLPIVPAFVLLALAPGGAWWPPEVIVGLVIASAVASTVRFDIGSGSTSPLMVLHVPLWFAVPPAWTPFIVGLTFVLGRLIENWFHDERVPIWRVVMGATDAAATLGPAIVFTLAGAPEPTPENFGIFALAFLAQAVLDLFAGVAASAFIHGLRPTVQGRLMVWIIGVDAALAPVGFLGAVLMRDHPLIGFALLPLIVVLGEFARERRHRIDQAVELSSAYRGTAQLMGDVLEADDAYTGGEHTQGVVSLAIAVGLEMRLTPAQMRDIEFGALLHDIGKLRVPNEIINKPGSLTEAEWTVVRQHPIVGQEMLDRVGGALAQAGLVVRAHHERWDGAGYPDGLSGRDIPVAARVITVCDSFSAMTTTRSYRKARTVGQALEELERCAGTQFDPSVVKALEVVLDRSGGTIACVVESDLPAAARAFGLGASA